MYIFYYLFLPVTRIFFSSHKIHVLCPLYSKSKAEINIYWAEAIKSRIVYCKLNPIQKSYFKSFPKILTSVEHYRLSHKTSPKSQQSFIRMLADLTTIMCCSTDILPIISSEKAILSGQFSWFQDQNHGLNLKVIILQKYIIELIILLSLKLMQIQN